MEVGYTTLISNRALYHAKHGNFSGFRVSIPLNLTEENCRFLYDNIRLRMDNIHEEDETWFNYDEFVNYFNDSRNTPEPLFESTSLQTRIKLSRAAKRSSKRRARKRFMRRKIRKNKEQLRKRAYSQVKNALRKRLTGGREWSSIPISSRMRIDATINKRKSILIRMIKSRMPKMAGQETERLRKVRLNSSAEYSTNLPILFEETEEQKVRRQNRARQQKRRASLTGDVSSFLDNLMLVKSKTGREMVITKQSYNKKEHEVLEKSGKVTMSKAKALTTRINFDQTPTSVKLFGLYGDASGEKKKKKEKKEEEMSTSNESEAQEQAPVVEVPPPGPREGSPSGDSIYNDNEHTVDQISMSNVVAINLLNQGYTPSAILGELGRAQQFMRSTEVGAKTTPEEKKAVANIEKILKSSNISDDAVNLLTNSQTLMEAGLRSIIPLLKNKNLIGIPGGDLSKYTALLSNTFTFPTTSIYKNDSGNNGEELATSNIILFNRDIISDNAGKQLDPKQFHEECVKHITLWNIGSGRVTDEKGKEIPQSKIEEATEYVNEFVAKYGNSAMIGVVVKAGESAKLPGSIKGEANALVQYVLRLDTLTTPIKTIVDPTWKKATKNYDDQKGNEKLTDINGNVIPKDSDEKVSRNQEKLHQTLSSEVLDKLSKDKDFVSITILQALTGIYKFNESSPAIASLIITQNKDGTDSALTEINMNYSDTISNNTKLRIGINVGYTETQQEVQDGILFDQAVVKRSKDKKIEISAAKTEIRKEIQELRTYIEGKMKAEEISIEEAEKAKFEELVNSGISKKEAQEKIALKERIYKYTTVLSLIPKRPGEKTAPQIPVVEKFQYNPILRFLTEIKISQKDSEALNNYSDLSLQTYIDDAKKWIGDTASRLLKFFNSAIDVVVFDDVNLGDYAKKETNGLANRVYINGQIKDIPVEKDVDYQAMLSERYTRIGSLFLSENKKKRDYKKEYEDYHGKPEQRKARSKRVLARRALEKMGRVHKGDGKDVDHKDGNPMNNSLKNLRVRDRSENRADH